MVLITDFVYKHLTSTYEFILPVGSEVFSLFHKEMSCSTGIMQVAQCHTVTSTDLLNSCAIFIHKITLLKLLCLGALFSQPHFPLHSISGQISFTDPSLHHHHLLSKMLHQKTTRSTVLMKIELVTIIRTGGDYRYTYRHFSVHVCVSAHDIFIYVHVARYLWKVIDYRISEQ